MLASSANHRKAVRSATFADSAAAVTVLHVSSAGIKRRCAAESAPLLAITCHPFTLDMPGLPFCEACDPCEPFSGKSPMRESFFHYSEVTEIASQASQASQTRIFKQTQPQVIRSSRAGFPVFFGHKAVVCRQVLRESALRHAPFV